MKISIIDNDIEVAARIAFVLKNSFSNVVVEYCESLEEESLPLSSIVLADPAPRRTGEWLHDFRGVCGNTPLILVSNNTDLLSGSLGDGCYALTKKDSAKELIEIIRSIVTGKPYFTGFSEQKRCN